MIPIHRSTITSTTNCIKIIPITLSNTIKVVGTLHELPDNINQEKYMAKSYT